MLEKEYQYYLENQQELLKKYEGQFIIIKDNEVVGNYSSEPEAYNQSIKKYEIGTFLIQHCLPGKAINTSTFHSRVIV